jgi:hypothetical protein
VIQITHVVDAETRVNYGVEDLPINDILEMFCSQPTPLFYGKEKVQLVCQKNAGNSGLVWSEVIIPCVVKEASANERSVIASLKARLQEKDSLLAQCEKQVKQLLDQNWSLWQQTNASEASHLQPSPVRSGSEHFFPLGYSTPHRQHSSCYTDNSTRVEHAVRSLEQRVALLEQRSSPQHSDRDSETQTDVVLCLTPSQVKCSVGHLTETLSELRNSLVSDSSPLTPAQCSESGDLWPDEFVEDNLSSNNESGLLDDKGCKDSWEPRVHGDLLKTNDPAILAVGQVELNGHCSQQPSVTRTHWNDTSKQIVGSSSNLWRIEQSCTSSTQASGEQTCNTEAGGEHTCHTKAGGKHHTCHTKAGKGHQHPTGCSGIGGSCQTVPDVTKSGIETGQQSTLAEQQPVTCLTSGEAGIRWCSGTNLKETSDSVGLVPQPGHAGETSPSPARPSEVQPEKCSLEAGDAFPLNIPRLA